MQTRVLPVIFVGITIGFLLGMGTAALLRSLIAGHTPELEVAFMAMAVMMAGGLVFSVVKTAR